MGHGASIIPPPLNKYVIAVFAFWYEISWGGRIRDLEEFGNGGAVWQQQGWRGSGAGFSRWIFSSDFTNEMDEILSNWPGRK